MFLRTSTTKSTGSFSEKLEGLRGEINSADAILIGAGAGLSTAAGLSYSGERFRRYFFDFADKYGIKDMYSGGFYPFGDMEEFWAWWSRQIWCNRYHPGETAVYERLYEIVKDKDYFVLTTNVDHQFQLAGFDKDRLFYTQGDYSLWQCSVPCHNKTYDNEDTVRKMILSQGFQIADDGAIVIPENVTPEMRVPSELVPHCPVCGKLMSMNLRCDDTFVEDEGWHAANERYGRFLKKNEDNHILYLELGVGMNTPGIIKYPFWQMTARNNRAVYACVNYGEAFCPKEIEKKSICIDADIEKVLRELHIC